MATKTIYFFYHLPFTMAHILLFFLLKECLNFFRASIFLNFSEFEHRITLKLFFKYQRCNFVQRIKEYIPIFVDILLHHKSRQEFIFCIDNAKVHLKYYKQYYNSDTKKFLCFDEAEPCFVLKLFLSFSEILNLIILVNFILIKKSVSLF